MSGLESELSVRKQAQCTKEKREHYIDLPREWAKASCLKSKYMCGRIWMRDTNLRVRKRKTNTEGWDSRLYLLILDEDKRLWTRNLCFCEKTKSSENARHITRHVTRTYMQYKVQVSKQGCISDLTKRWKYHNSGKSWVFVTGGSHHPDTGRVVMAISICHQLQCHLLDCNLHLWPLTWHTYEALLLILCGI